MLNNSHRRRGVADYQAVGSAGGQSFSHQHGGGDDCQAVGSAGEINRDDHGLRSKRWDDSHDEAVEGSWWNVL